MNSMDLRLIHADIMGSIASAETKTSLSEDPRTVLLIDACS
jgi:hypothetical protein